MMANGWWMAIGSLLAGVEPEASAAPVAGSAFANPWVVPGIVLASAIVIGWILDRVVRTRLERWASTTAWRGDDIILISVRGLTWLWLSLIGLHVAAGLAPLHERLHELVSRLVEVAFIVSVTVAAGRIATSSFALYSERLAFKGGASVVTLLIKIVLFTVGGLVILQTEGISITPLLTALGVGGLAVALALQDTLGNIFAGIHTLMAGQIKPGDFIKLDADNEGYVVDIGWRNTSIRSPANNLVVVPNKKLGESLVVNYSKPEPHMSLSVPVGVAYESDLDHVEAVLLALGNEIAATTPGVQAGHPPAVRFASLGDSAIDARLVLRVDSIETFHLVRHLVVKAIHRRFRREGIVIPYPTRTLYVADGSAVTPPAVSPPSAIVADRRAIDADVERHADDG